MQEKGYVMKYFKKISFILGLLIVFFNVSISSAEIENKDQKIPKIIHYVWLGSEELPNNVKEAIETWKKYQPDFQIKRWDEKNCDINSNPFIKGAYTAKKYDYASDYCRIKALQSGGVYFDTDMLLKAPIDPLLDEPLVLALQRKNDLSASFIAVIPNHPFVNELNNFYQKTKFIGNTEQNAPSIWNRVFHHLFNTNQIEIERKPGIYHIYAPNIMMYDFNGGETVAEHLFGAGSTDVQKSRWYNIFRKDYLKQYAFYFPSEDKYFIFQNNRNGYFHDLEKNKSEKPIEYSFEGEILKISPWTSSFFCKNRTCYPKNKP